MATKPIYVIADLHLNEDSIEITQGFIDFLERTALEASALYILGDLFDAWIGDDAITPFTKKIACAIKSLSDKGICCYFMPGNRDFLLGKRYANQSGMTLILQPTYLLSAFGHKIALLHGDTLCTDDKAYQRYRKVVHNRFIQWIFNQLPLSYRKRLAQKLRQSSQLTNQQKSANIMDVNQEAVNLLAEHHQIDYLIHGHTHRPNTHILNNPQRTRMVLGAWDTRGWAISIGKTVTLFSFDLTGTNRLNNLETQIKLD